MKPQLNFYASISQHHTSTQACHAHPCKIVCISQMHRKVFGPVHHFNAISFASLCISSALYHSSFLAQLRHHLLLKFLAPSLSALILYVHVFFSPCSISMTAVYLLLKLSALSFQFSKDRDCTYASLCPYCLNHNKHI